MANTVVKMPQLGESVAEGTIGRWLKQPGDRVERDEPLVEIQTDKVNAEVPSPVAGILQRILLQEGTTAAVKTDMAIIGDEQPADEDLSPASDAPAAQGPEGTTTQRTPAESVAAEPAPLTFSYDASAGGGVVGHRDEDHAAQAAPADGAPLEDASLGKRFYTPVVLRMAEEHDLDLSTITGSGAHGRVTRRDVERAIGEPHAAPQPPAPASQLPLASAAAGPAQLAQSTAESRSPLGPASELRSRQTVATGVGPQQPQPSSRAAGDEDRALTPMRRAIADHMVRARAQIPDAWSLVEIDVTKLARYRESLQAEWQAREGYELTSLPFFVKAVLAGLRAVPELNATFTGVHISVHREYALGIAVSIEQGLVVPVLRDADQLSVAGIARALRNIVQKARSGKLGLADVQGATFTVNNPGSLGSIMSQPIVPVGQSGIVTMEAIVKRPVVTADDAIAVRSMMNSCLSFDHRVLDGADALKFLRTIKHHLETVELPLY